MGIPLLRVSGLECTRGERRLFSNLSFDLDAGALVQVRGANGSGKTSLLRIVCGLLPPDAGEVSWNGRAIREHGDEFRAHVAFVGHLNALKEELDPAENLRYAARIAGLETTPADVEAALRTFALGGVRLPCRLLSQGQKRRAALARVALSRSRALWVLDEPFVALDAEGVAAMRSLVEAHLARGGAAMFTTHQEVEFSRHTVQRIEFGERREHA
jgi:heme exporter protein A